MRSELIRQLPPVRMETGDLVTAYVLTAQLRDLPLDRDIDARLRTWMFTLQEALGARGELGLVRDLLPWWADPDDYEPVSLPRTAPPPGKGPGRPLKAIAALSRHGMLFGTGDDH